MHYLLIYNDKIRDPFVRLQNQLGKITRKSGKTEPNTAINIQSKQLLNLRITFCCFLDSDLEIDQSFTGLGSLGDAGIFCD